MVSPLLPTQVQVPSDEHLTTQEVTHEPREIIHEPRETVNCENCGIDSISNVEIQDRYELPLRSTRGVPPKRYPEFEAQQSRYFVQKVSEENVSQKTIFYIFIMH